MVVFISILSFLSAGLQKFPLLCGFRQLQLIRLSDLLLFQIPQGKIRFPQSQIGIIVRIPVFQDLRPSPGKDSHLPVESGHLLRRILKAAGLRKDGVNIVSCPTCGRTRIDLIGLVNRVDEALKNCEKPITVAVMGCVVNGPGEASAADIGVAGGKGEGLIFRHGEVLYKVAQEKLLDALLEEIEKL